MPSCLVTGGAGFIGSHVVRELLNAGWQVTVVDNFDPFYARTLKWQNLSDLQTWATFHLIEADIRDSAALRSLSGRFDAIVHLAAKAGVRPSIQDPTAYQDVNVAGTQNVLEFARERCIRQFVFASSSSVYGVNPNVPWRENDHVLLPISPYASTKVSGELLGHVYAHLYGIRFVALRFFTVFGPGQRPDLAIHKFARLMLNGRPIPVYGDGSTKRDYTFVADIVAGVVAAVNYTGSRYEVINLGNNRTVALVDLIAALEDALGIDASVLFEPEQPGDVPQTCADITKANRLLGYQPRTDLESGLRQFASWLHGSGAAVRAGSFTRAQHA